jgi:hypothetical protein
MGLSSKKTTGATTSQSADTSSATSTPSVPSWIQNPSMQVAGNVQSLLNAGPAATTPQISSLEQQAFTNAGNLGAGTGSYNAAGTTLGSVPNVTGQTVTGSSLLDGGLDQYYNPFKSQVLDPTLADYDQQSGITRAAQAAQAAAGQAFQGSRYGIQEAQTEDNLARGRASTEGTLLNSMYGQATTLADEDAARRQQAALANQSTDLSAQQSNQSAALQKAQQLASLGTAQGSDERANLGVMAGLGGVQTDAENAISQYPLQYQQQIEGLLSGLNPSLYTGKTVDTSGTSTGSGTSTSTTSDPMGTIGQIAKIAALFAPVPA